MSFAFVSEDISPDTSLSLKSVAHLKNKKSHKIYMYAYEIKVTKIQTIRSTRLVIIAHLLSNNQQQTLSPDIE
jgi:hypothetical protein